MYAVIMAGGEGRRLRPLTSALPKPLVPVAGKPAMSRIIELLASHKINKAAVTAHYKAELIEQTYGGLYRGVELVCFREETPLGTAGSVRNTLSMLERDGGDDSFIVISGDAVCELDLTAAIAYHRRKNADATIMLTRAYDVGEYGVVACADDGSVKRFIEKPSPSQAFADTVNTGIYILKRSVLDLVPSDRPYDFGKDLFPEMLRLSMRLYGITDGGYWCDIGSIGAYYDCNIRMALLEKSVDSRGNVVNGAAVIGSGATVRECVISDDVIIGSECRIERAVICPGVRIGRNTVIRAGCVVGNGSKIGNNVVIDGGAKIMDGITVGNGTVVMGSVIFGSVSANIFKNGGIRCAREAISGEYAVRIGAAAGSAVKNGRIGVMCADDTASRVICDALLCGIRCSGSNAVDLLPDGGGFEAMAAYTARLHSLDAVMFVRAGDEESAISLYDSLGLYPKRAFERGMASYLAVGGGESQSGVLIRSDGCCENYESYISRSADGLAGLRLRISGEGAAADMLLRILNRAGAVCTRASDGGSGLRLHIAESGDSLTLFDADELPLADMWHICALILTVKAKALPKIALPYCAPDAFSKLCESLGVTMRLYSGCPADDSEDDIRALAAESPWTRDALLAAVELCAIIKEKNVVSLLERLPGFTVSFRDIDADRRPLTELGEPAQEGVVNCYRDGMVKIIPRGGGYRIYAEATSSEAAEELAALTVLRIRDVKESLQK